MRRAVFLGSIWLLFGAFAFGQNPTKIVRIADPNATPETRALFANLRTLSGRGILFGHQDDTVSIFRK